MIRGPVRPDVESVINNILSLKKKLLDLKPELEIDTFLVTTTKFDGDSSIDPRLNSVFDNLIFLPRVSKEKLDRSTFGHEWWPTGQNLWNTVNLHYAAKAGIGLIKEIDEYEFIIHTRTDLIDILISKQDINKWFNKNYYNVIYSMFSDKDINTFDFNHEHSKPFGHRVRAHADGIHSELYTFDHFAIATPEIMYQAWNFHNPSLLSSFIFNSIIPENILDQILHYNKVKIQHIKDNHEDGCLYFKLDPNRGKGKV